MFVVINGQKKEFSDELALKEIIAQCSCATVHVIAEVNGKIIKSPDWAKTTVREGDKIELVAFVGGG